MYASGRARLNKVRVLPAETLTIPQRTGEDVTIPILDVDVAKKALGVWNPDKKYVKETKEKGLSWASKARNTGYVTT